MLDFSHSIYICVGFGEYLWNSVELKLMGSKILIGMEVLAMVQSGAHGGRVRWSDIYLISSVHVVDFNNYLASL